MLVYKIESLVPEISKRLWPAVDTVQAREPVNVGEQVSGQIGYLHVVPGDRGK